MDYFECVTKGEIKTIMRENYELKKELKTVKEELRLLRIEHAKSISRTMKTIVNIMSENKLKLDLERKKNKELQSMVNNKT